MSKYNDRNPRFVWNIGAIAEVFPDMSKVEGLVLYDRQEQKVVMELKSEYANAVCLELNRSAKTEPFTNLENWFNIPKNAAFVSEGIPPTK